MNIFLGKMEIFDVKFNIKGIDSSKEGLEWIANSIYVVIKGYSGIAESIGNEDTTRSVGSSCNKNPIMIINLCHRVFSKKIEILADMIVEVLLNKNYLNSRILLKTTLHSLYKFSRLYPAFAGLVEGSL